MQSYQKKFKNPTVKKFGLKFHQKFEIPLESGAAPIGYYPESIFSLYFLVV